MQTTDYRLFFDGACEREYKWGPRCATYGWILTQGNTIVDGGKGIATKGYKATNNVAEYHGLIAGLRACFGRGITNLMVCGDSQLVIRQMEGKYRVKATHLYPLYREADRLCEEIGGVRFKWIPREHNEWADHLSRDL